MQRTWIFAILLTGNALVAHADDLTEIVDRYTAWRGGAAYEHLQSIHQQGALQTAGLEGTEEVWADVQGRVRVDDNTGVVKQVQVVSGGASWDTAPSGQVETLAVSDRQSVSRLAALQFSSPFRAGEGVTVKLASAETRDGRTWSVVRVSFGDEDTYDALIDPQTGALGGFHIMEDRQGRFEGYGDWRFVDGVRMPFLHTVKSDAPGDDATVKLAAIELNRPLTPALLDRPASVHKAVFKSGVASTGWIDFELFSGNRIYFQAKVNGHDVAVLLDSGASISSIDKTFASSIGLQPKGGFTGPGGGGVETFGFIGGVEVQLGDLSLHDLKVGAFDFAAVAKDIGHPTPFVLGDELFNEVAIDIDFEHHRIAFHDPASVSKPSGSVEIPLLRVKDRTVPVSVEGAAPVPFEFDLGQGSALAVFPAYYKAHKLLDSRRSSQTIGGGVGGYHPETVAALRRVTFADVDFSEVPTHFTADVLSANNSNLVLGSIGVSILARFALLIDYSHDRLFATPAANALSAPFVKDRLGLYLVRKDANFTVELVSPGSPAQAAGFKVGDQLARIDQQSNDAWTEPALRDLRDRTAGTVVVFTLVDGGVREVKLADFY